MQEGICLSVTVMAVGLCWESGWEFMGGYTPLVVALSEQLDKIRSLIKFYCQNRSHVCVCAFVWCVFVCVCVCVLPYNTL